MAITYTWEITNLKVQTVSDEKQNAVVQTYWRKIGTDENGNEGVFSGATPFTVDPTDNSGPFIPFEELTEADVIAWVQSVVVGSYEQHVNEQIAKQIAEKVSPITDKTLPWAPPAPEAPTEPAA